MLYIYKCYICIKTNINHISPSFLYEHWKCARRHYACTVGYDYWRTHTHQSSTCPFSAAEVISGEHLYLKPFWVNQGAFTRSAAVKQRFRHWEGHLSVMYINVYHFPHSLIAVHSQAPSFCAAVSNSLVLVDLRSHLNAFVSYTWVVATAVHCKFC